MLSFINKRKLNKKRKEWNYLYICDCGNQVWQPKYKVVSGHIKSCGCLKKRYAKQHAIEMAKNNITHGMSLTRPYTIWHCMLQRCTNKKSESYKNYGARGIEIDKNWFNFNNFWNDMKLGYAENLTIERINNNDNYYKENCKWITQQEQNNNKRSCHFIEYNGKRMNIKQWCNFLKLNDNTVRVRIYRGMNELKALQLI